MGWISEFLTRDVAHSRNELLHGLDQERAQQEQQLYAVMETKYNRELTAWLTAMRIRRGPLLRELWASLWTSSLGRAKSVLLAMERIGVSANANFFHQVTMYEHDHDRHYVVLEQAGAPSEEPDHHWEEGENRFTRKHACANMLDAYECMRGDNEAPPGNSNMHRFLHEQCNPSRIEWDSYLLANSPGRKMMVNKTFAQQILVNLIDNALNIPIPDFPAPLPPPPTPPASVRSSLIGHTRGSRCSMMAPLAEDDWLFEENVRFHIEDNVHNKMRHSTEDSTFELKKVRRSATMSFADAMGDQPEEDENQDVSSDCRPEEPQAVPEPLPTLQATPVQRKSSKKRSMDRATTFSHGPRLKNLVDDSSM